MTAPSVSHRVAITFYCTHAQRDKYMRIMAENMGDSLNDWVVETLDNYCDEIIEEREAIQSE